jgi:hypothetical protein
MIPYLHMRLRQVIEDQYQKQNYDNGIVSTEHHKETNRKDDGTVIRLDNDEADQSSDEEIDQLDDDTSVIPIEPSAAIPSHGQTVGINFSHMPIVTVNKEGWPEWLRDWFGVFTSKNFGLLWISLVVKWTEIEHSYKWASSVSDQYCILPGYCN